MATEVVTLKPASGDELALVSPYHLGLETEWGEHVIEPSLATGPDIVGGIVGVRERQTAEATLPIWVREETGSAYLAAANALVDAATNLARFGGTIARQVEFQDGTLSEELETEVLSCDIDPEDGWFQAHRLSAIITLNITRNPAWLAEEAEIGTDATFTDSVKRLALSDRRGNLPGPGRIVLADNDSTARRFVEIGGAFTQEPQQVEYLAADFTLEAASSADDTAGGAIGANCLFLTSVLPAPQTLGTLEDLPLVGSYRARLRFRGGDDDSEYFVRVVWRSGSGPWQELDWVSAPDSTNYYDVDAGTILHLGDYASEAITVRVDVKSSASSTADFRLNGLTLTPSELYVVSRGLDVDVPSEGLVAFDDFADMEDGDVLDDGATPRVAPQGGTWDEAGDSTPEFTSGGFGNITRTSANDGTGSIATGQYVLLGSTDYTTIENTICGYVSHKGSTLTESWLGALVRYVDTSNWLIAALRVRRKNDGTYITYVSLYKRVAGTITQIAQKRAKGLFNYAKDGNNEGYLTGAVGVSVTTAGAYAVKVGIKGDKAQTESTILTGTDSVLATSGALEDGKIGAYSLVQSSNSTAFTGLNEILAFSTLAASEHTDVIRADGLGVLTDSTAYTADSDATDPQPITSYQGSRIWLPPGTGGEITAKVRSSDSEIQPDEGTDLDTGITAYHRPAFANLSEALEALYPEDTLYPGDDLLPVG